MLRIKYISRFTRELSAEEIDELVRESARHNAEVGITGVLLANGGLFFQVIEGPDEEVTKLYLAIRNDPRHEDVLLLDHQQGELDRLFPEWAMRKVDLRRGTEGLTEPLKAILGAVFDLDRQMRSLIGVLERAMWTAVANAPRK